MGVAHFFLCIEASGRFAETVGSRVEKAGSGHRERRRSRRLLRFAVAIGCLFGPAACTGSTESAFDGGSAIDSGIQGYVHTLARSRFAIGEILRETDEFGMHKVTGENGVFATETVSRAATAIPNDFPLNVDGGGTFPGGYPAQNDAVVSYLTGAGLPAEQVLSVTDNETGISRLEMVDQPIVVAWFSILHRGYRGVPIEESMASVILGSEGQSREEQVYWPALGQEVVTELRAFQGTLADERKHAAFLAILPSQLEDGHLSIHHTAWDWKGPFEAHACFRGRLGSTSVCFDPSGHLVRLADEPALAAD